MILTKQTSKYVYYDKLLYSCKFIGIEKYLSKNIKATNMEGLQNTYIN